MNTSKILAIFPILCLFISNMQAAVLVDVKIINEEYLLVEYEDGEITYFDNLGQSPEDDQDNLNPLNINQAINTLNYEISSTTDSNYATTQNPIEISRFTYGKDFSGKTGFPINYIHKIYLKLPNTLQSNSSYSIVINNVEPTGYGVQIEFNEFQHQSSAVHVNHIGYKSSAGLKYGYISKYVGETGGVELNSYANTPFHLVDNLTGAIVFSGQINERWDLQTGIAQDALGNEHYGADVWECDFSSFQTPGIYKLVVEKFGSSYPFEIGESIYSPIFYDVARTFYHLRCGVELTSEFTNFPRPLCHHPDVGNYMPTYSNVQYQYFLDAPFDELVNNDTGVPMPTAFRHYHDAADWDSRSDHLEICIFLQTLYELKPNSFVDNQLNIPESGNGIPDILDESKFGLDAYRKLLGPTGGVCGGIEENEHPLPGDASYLDTRPWFTFAEEPKATYQTVAALAQYAAIMESLNETDSLAVYTQEAENLYTWALNNTAAGDESIVYEARILAASMLYKLTGDAFYNTEFTALYDDYGNYIAYPENSYFLHFALFHYAINPLADASYVTNATNDFLAWVNFTGLTPASDRAFRFANNPYAPFGYGTASTPQIYALVLAHELTNDVQYLNYANTTLDFYLGNNMENINWIMGHGHNNPDQILLLDSWVDGIEENIPGFAVYGTSHPPQEFGWISFDGHGYTGSYPDWWDIPVGSAYMDNRYCPKTAEFTVHESNGRWAFAIGYFLDDALIPTNVAEPHIVLDDQSITVYPNPSNIEVTIQGLQQAYNIEILDMMGNVFATINSASFSQTININNLPAGMYFLALTAKDNSKVHLQKIIKL